jgi:L-fuculose-phosphate aldolase
VVPAPALAGLAVFRFPRPRVTISGMSIPHGLLKEFQDVGRDLYRLGLVSSHGGNLSVRERDIFWITGTGTRLGHLESRHISRVTLDGRHEGPPPSSDTILHATVYAVSGATAVAHGHPRHATAITYSTDLYIPEDFEGQHFLKEVPVIEQGPGQVEALAIALQSHLIAILRGHGAYARGRDLWEALHWLTALEESAQVSWLKRTWERHLS